MKSPVLFIVFNRPETTRTVFDAIRASRPPRLYVAADGPRSRVANEDVRCQQVRDIATNVDWPCQLTTRFSDVNLGCKKGVSSALNWFFDQEEEGIVLEDDVLPVEGFFEYCDELLDRYRGHPEIGIISGCNLVTSNCQGTSSYFFSRYAHIWGWATWRRTWRLYDVTMTAWPAWRDGGGLTEEFTANAPQQAYWRGMLDQVYEGKIDTWDYQLAFACWRNNMLSIIPSRNLTLNIGFGIDATHTVGETPKLVRKSAPKPITFPLDHPDRVERTAKTDDEIWRKVFRRKLISRIKLFLLSLKSQLFHNGVSNAK